MKKLDAVLSFTSLINSFQKIKRAVLINSEDTFENDLEHSYQLSLVAWYLVTSQKLKLDKDKVIKYALAHDIVEVYAGDVNIFTKDFYKSGELLKQKHKNEELSFAKIKEQFPEFDDLFEVIEAYEKREEPEAKFVYALDKLLPVINIYLDNGRSWRKAGTTIDMLKTKSERIAMSKEVTEIWKELLKLVEKDKTLFN